MVALPSTWEMEAEGSVQGQPQLHSKCEAIKVWYRLIKKKKKDLYMHTVCVGAHRGEKKKRYWIPWNCNYRQL